VRLRIAIVASTPARATTRSWVARSMTGSSRTSQHCAARRSGEQGDRPVHAVGSGTYEFEVK